MKCFRCDAEAHPNGPKLRVIETGRVLIFCTLFCRSWFMKKARDPKEFRAFW